MQLVRFGGTDLKLTKVGFGGIPIRRLSEDDAIRVIRHAIEKGINWFDSANGYDISENYIGKAIKHYDRKSLHYFTKSHRRKPQEVREDIQLSLKRAQIDYIDLYQFHLVTSSELWQQMMDDGTVDVVIEEKKKGIVKHIGVSTHKLEPALEAMKHPEIETIQYPFNFIECEAAVKVLAEAKKRDIGFISMKPFGGGLLDNASACIGCLMQHREIVFDPGFERIEEVDEVIKLVQERTGLTENDKKTIKKYKKELGDRFCRRCGYCSPCEHGVNIVTLMNLKSIAKRLSEKQLLDKKDNFYQAYESIDDCIECGRCELKCPYELSIRKSIRENAEFYRLLLESE